MTKTILAMGASNSRNSINKEFANYAAHQIPEAKIDMLDLNDFEMPIYSIDREKETGIPQEAHDFKGHIKQADGIIISFAEHNGAYATAFKNIYDWISRLERDVWANLPMLLMATSPGGRGGRTVLEIATKKFGFSNSNVVLDFSLPSFKQNFNSEKGIVNDSLKEQFTTQLNKFINAL